MRRALAILALVAFPASAQVLPGHRLPEGPERPVRDRSFHIKSYKAELRFDMVKEEVAGVATVTFESLRAPLTELSLDAARLRIEKVERDGKPLKFTVDPKAWKLNVALGEPLALGREATVKIAYACNPRVGMYFFPASDGREAQAWNYGEGGLHYAWLPIYNDTNDRFAVEFVVTVPRGFTAVGNGVLDGPRENPDGTRTFRWVEEKPIPNYLMTVDVGELRAHAAGRREGRDGRRAAFGLDEARDGGGGEVLIRRHAADGRVLLGADGLPLPVGQVRPGAPARLRGRRDGDDDHDRLRRVAPAPEAATLRTPRPTSRRHGRSSPYEDTISHELAHHWFGDMVTCRSIGSIWLNESFATFWHTVWNGHAHGEDDLTYQRWWYLNKYVDYVRATGTVRPMEYLRYREPTAMYQTESTYVKGSLVLHMVRHFMGDADFYRMIADYLRRHELSSVESADLAEAIELASRTQLLLVLPGLGRRRRRPPAVRRVLPLGPRAQPGGPDGQADPVGPAVRERVPPARGRRDRGRVGSEDAPRRADGLVHDGRAAGGRAGRAA